MATDGLHDPADAGSQSPHGESAVPYKSNSGVGAIPAPAGSDGLAGAEAGAGAGASASAGAGKAAEPEVAVAVVAPDGGAAVDGARGSGGAAAASGADTPSRAIQMPEDPTWHEAYCNKGNISNLVTFVIMVVGLVWVLLEPSDADGAKTASRDVGDYVLALGLFGFAGGTTNWLAVKMLFDRIPYIYGSGVIPARFKEIRETVKDTIMATFFDSAYLKTYLTSRAKTFLSDLQLGECRGAGGSCDGSIIVSLLMVCLLTRATATVASLLPHCVHACGVLVTSNARRGEDGRGAGEARDRRAHPGEAERRHCQG